MLVAFPAALALAFVPQGARPTSTFYGQRAPAISALAPSGIDGLPLLEQQEVFACAFAALGAGTIGLTTVCNAIIPDGIGKNAVKASSLIGLAFMAAGYAHFALPEAYQAIYPPLGTWGIWYLPGSAEFHVAWTGVAEFLGGLGVFLGGALDALGLSLGGRARPLRMLAAQALFGLMVAVCPANLYQYTHGAIMVGAGPDGPLPLEYHYIRLIIQIALLTVLGFLARDEEPLMVP